MRIQWPGSDAKAHQHECPCQPGTAAPILLREDTDGIAMLTLNRPAARNSLSEELIDGARRKAFDAIARDGSIRAVVIAANGPAFCAGHDLKELTARRSDPDGGRAYFRHIMTTCSAMMQQIVALPQPVIAAVSRRRDRGGLPAGRDLRSCDRFDRSEIRNAGRRYRAVLLDADGGADAQCPAQECDADAADRRAGHRGQKPRAWASINRVVPRRQRA